MNFKSDIQNFKYHISNLHLGPHKQLERFYPEYSVTKVSLLKLRRATDRPDLSAKVRVAGRESCVAGG